MNGSILTVTFLGLIESLDDGNWGLYDCDAEMVDGTVMRGTIQGDGRDNWDEVSFQADEDFVNRYQFPYDL